MKVPFQLTEGIVTATQKFIANERSSQVGKINLIGLICLTLYLIIFLFLLAVPAWLQLVKVILGKPTSIEMLIIGSLSIAALPITIIASGVLVSRTESPAK